MGSFGELRASLNPLEWSLQRVCLERPSSPPSTKIQLLTTDVIPSVAEAKAFQKPFDTKNTFLPPPRTSPLPERFLSLCHFQSVSLGPHPGADKCPLRAQGSPRATGAFTAHSLLTGRALTIPPCTLFIYCSPLPPSLPPRLYRLLLLRLGAPCHGDPHQTLG